MDGCGFRGWRGDGEHFHHGFARCPGWKIGIPPSRAGGHARRPQAHRRGARGCPPVHGPGGCGVLSAADRGLCSLRWCERAQRGPAGSTRDRRRGRKRQSARQVLHPEPTTRRRSAERRIRGLALPRPRHASDGGPLEGPRHRLGTGSR